MIYVNRLTNLPEEIISTCTENSKNFIQITSATLSKYENFLPEVS